MDKIKYSDIINHYLKIDYKLRSDILINLSQHIDKLYDNYILTTDERKKINTLINDTINNLNNYYNKISLIIFPDNKLDNYDIDHNDIIDKEYKLENDIILDQMKTNFNYIIYLSLQYLQ